MMKRLIAASFLALAACSPAGPNAPTAEEIAKASGDLTVWFDAEYDELLQMSPMQLTMLGRKDQYDKIDQFTDVAADAKLAWEKASVVEMKAKFDPARLDAESRTSFDMWALQAEMDEKLAAFRRQGYVFVKDGPHSSLANFLITFHAVAEKSDMEAYIKRLSEVARALDQSVEQAKLAAEAGVRPPRFAYDQATQEASNVITGAPFGVGADSPLWADAKTKIKALADGGKLTADEAKAMEASARTVLVDTVKPSYERIIAYLKDDRPKAAEQSQGVGTFAKGADFYNAMLEVQTTTKMTADEIHELGLKEVARLRSEMESIREKVGFKGDLTAFLAFMRTDK